MDSSATLIFANELANFSVCYLHMPSGWLEGVLANLAQDRFSERRWLAKQNGLEVKVLMIRTAILDSLCETKPIGF
jgi:hypothetical protein